MNATTIPNVFTAGQFQDGCAEASTLRLPPGVAPHDFKVMGTDWQANYTFNNRISDGEETHGWTYKRVSMEGQVTPTPRDCEEFITILND